MLSSSLFLSLSLFSLSFPLPHGLGDGPRGLLPEPRLQDPHQRQGQQRERRRGPRERRDLEPDASFFPFSFSALVDEHGEALCPGEDVRGAGGRPHREGAASREGGGAAARGDRGGRRRKEPPLLSSSLLLLPPPQKTLFSSSTSSSSAERWDPSAGPPLFLHLDDLQRVDYPERHKGKERSRGPGGDDEAAGRTAAAAVVVFRFLLPPLPREGSGAQQPRLVRRDPGKSIGVLPRRHRLDSTVVVFAAGADLFFFFFFFFFFFLSGKKGEEEEREKKKESKKGDLLFSCSLFLPSSALSYLDRVIVVEVPEGPGPRGRVDGLVRVVGPNGCCCSLLSKEMRVEVEFFSFFQRFKPIIIRLFALSLPPHSSPPSTPFYRSRKVLRLWTLWKELESGEAQQVEERREQHRFMLFEKL